VQLYLIHRFKYANTLKAHLDEKHTNGLLRHNKECEGAFDETDPEAKRSRVYFEYTFVKTFKDLDEAKAHVKELKTFVFKTTRKSKEGSKQYYTCKDKICSMRLYLLLDGTVSSSNLNE